MITAVEVGAGGIVEGCAVVGATVRVAAVVAVAVAAGRHNLTPVFEEG